MITHTKTKLSLALLVSVIGLSFAGQMHGMKKKAAKDVLHLLLDQSTMRVRAAQCEGKLFGVDSKYQLMGRMLQDIKPFVSFDNERLGELLRATTKCEREYKAGSQKLKFDLQGLIIKVEIAALSDALYASGVRESFIAVKVATSSKPRPTAPNYLEAMQQK